MADLHAVTTDDSRISLPPSGLEHLDRLLDQLHEALRQVLALSNVQYDDINARSSGFVIVGWNKYQWTALPDQAAPFVGAARDALRRLREFASNAARRAPDRAEELRKLETTLERIVEQPSGSYPNGAPKSTTDEIREWVKTELNEYRRVVRLLPSAHGTGERLLIADTSALLDRPDLQNWKLDGGSWTLVLLPQVHSELDDRKRDTRTREAAKKVIHQIEDFDRRGDTFIGVPLAGNITVREVPISPDMSWTLPWLRSDVPDDAIIAGALELAWQDLTSRIAITASDRNVRNKARLAGLGSVHPNDL
jgi:hypothetical protein